MNPNLAPTLNPNPASLWNFGHSLVIRACRQAAIPSVVLALSFVIRRSIAILLFTTFTLSAQSQPSPSIADRLQKGLFEEEARHNLPAAIEEYQAVIAEAEEQRSLLATAIFRLAESYRKLGRHDEARPLYERILRDFSDQTQLVQRASAHLPDRARNNDISEIPIPEPVHNFEAYDQLFTNSPDLLNSPATNSHTFLQHAAFSGDIEMIQFLIKRGAKLERTTPDKKDTPLMLAVRYGHKRAAEVLIQAGANLNAVEGGSSPLIIAASKGYNELTRLLLASGAKVNLEAENGYTALHAASASGHVEIIQLLAQAGANLNANAYWHTPITAAVEKRQSASIEALIRLGADPNRAPRSSFPPLLFAIQSRAVDMLDPLLTATNLDLNVRDRFGNTPLMIVVERGYLRQLESLLARKPDLNLTNDIGYTALHYAAFKDTVDYLQLLLEAGAHPNILSESAGTPLHVASGGPFLISNPGNERRVFGDGSPPNYQNQLANVSPDKIELLLKHNADPNLRDSRGNTPLAYAIGKSSLAAVTLLLGAEADPNIPDKQGNTGLDHVNPHRAPRLWELLKQAGATNSPAYQEALRSQTLPGSGSGVSLPPPVPGGQHLNSVAPISGRQIPSRRIRPPVNTGPQPPSATEKIPLPETDLPQSE